MAKFVDKYFEKNSSLKIFFVLVLNGRYITEFILLILEMNNIIDMKYIKELFFIIKFLL
jgi:hypothetical protein